jgi:hypothetical protein
MKLHYTVHHRTVANLKVLDEAMINVNANLPIGTIMTVCIMNSHHDKKYADYDRDELLDPEECEEALYACDFPLSWTGRSSPLMR